MKRGREAFDLLRAAAAYDSGGDGGMMQRPGNGDDAGFDVVRLADFAEEFYETKIAAQARLVEFGSAAPPVVLWQVRRRVRQSSCRSEGRKPSASN